METKFRLEIGRLSMCVCHVKDPPLQVRKSRFECSFPMMDSVCSSQTPLIHLAIDVTGLLMTSADPQSFFVPRLRELLYSILVSTNEEKPKCSLQEGFL